MATVIYTSPIFGPVHSRRLGVSLGINLMPGDGKVCSFDCLYCECGLNGQHPSHLKRPTRAEVRTALEERLKEMKAVGPTPDVLTFAGNGEPTGHPDFAAIMDDVIALRNAYFPAAQVSVLSNATFILRPKVFDALMKVDNNILKPNIAEGYKKLSKNDKLRFLNISEGSLAECRNYIILSRDLDFINERQYNQLFCLIEETSKLLTNYSKGIINNNGLKETGNNESDTFV